jgi:hypothetical protein
VGEGAADAAALERAVDHACFARGLACDPADPTTLGRHDACALPTGGGLLGLAENAEAMMADRPWRFHLIQITGGAATDVIAGPALAAACTGDDGTTAGPAPRLALFAELFPERASHADICAADWSAAFAPLGEYLIALGGTCLDAAVDLDPAADGIQADCAVTFVQRRADGTSAYLDQLPPCGGLPPGDACYQLAPDPVMCLEHPALDIHLGDRNEEGLAVDVRCRLACQPDEPAVLPPS